jgi:hypothetical protein
MSASGNENFPYIKITLLEIPNDPPATDSQKLAVRTVFMNAYDPSDLTMGQASLILDCASYMNGVIDFIKRYNPSLQMNSKSEMRFRVIGIELILNDEERRKDVKEWCRDNYSLGRSINLPHDDPQSKLFQDILLEISRQVPIKAEELQQSRKR